MADVELVEVPGIPRDVVIETFESATNGTGKVAGDDAVQFFKRTGLPVTDLATVWEYSTAGRPGGLTLQHFAKSLRLVAYLQSGLSLDQATAAWALSRESLSHLPPPQIEGLEDLAPFTHLQCRPAAPPAAPTPSPQDDPFLLLDGLQPPSSEYPLAAPDRPSPPCPVSLPVVTAPSPSGPGSPSGASSFVLFVYEGRDLVACDSNGKSDPYLQISYGNQRRSTSKVCKKTLAPAFEHSATFWMEPGAALEIKVFDQDLMSTDDFMGGLTLSAAALADKVTQGWFPLSGVHSGQLRLRVVSRGPGTRSAPNSPSAPLDVTASVSPTHASSKSASLRRSASSLAVPGDMLQISVVQGRGLLACDRNGKSDPYVEVVYGNHKPVRSLVQKRTLEPYWNFEVAFPYDPAASLEVRCMDWDQFGSNDFMGSVLLPAVSPWLRKPRTAAWVDLTGVAQGRLFLSILNTAAAEVAVDDAGDYSQSSLELTPSAQNNLLGVPQPPAAGLGTACVTGTSVMDTGDYQVAVEARLPPLDSRAARLKRLHVIKDSLFASPSASGGILRWVQVGRSIKMHTGQPGLEACVAHGEDADCPSSELADHTNGKVTCMYSNECCHLTWTGHADGQVTSWEARPDGTLTRVGSWQAHRVGQVAAMAQNQWGELWTASRFGSIRVWPDACQAVGKTKTARTRELRRADGTKAHQTVMHMQLSWGGQVVWSAGEFLINIWDAFSGVLIGSICTSPEGVNLEADAEMASVVMVDTAVGLSADHIGRKAGQPCFGTREDIKEPKANNLAGVQSGSAMLLTRGVKAARILKKVGRQWAAGRGKDAEAKDAEVGGGGPAGGRPPVLHRSEYDISDLAAGADDCMWVATKGGSLSKYTAMARLVLSLKKVGPGIQSLQPVGRLLWVGCTDGSIVVLEPDGRCAKSFKAHDSPVLSLAPAGTRVFSLDACGTVRGWAATSTPAQDEESQRQWAALAPRLIQRREVKILSATWNVNEGRASAHSLRAWLGGGTEQAHLVTVALQELEMGTKSVALGAVKDQFLSNMQETGNQKAQWWAQALLEAIDPSGEAWVRVCMRQMSGMLVLVFARTALEPSLADVCTASVATGVGGIGGNKGAVAVGFNLSRRRVAVLCSHFAAHQGAELKRNANYLSIAHNLQFPRAGRLKVARPRGTPPDASPPPGALEPEAQRKINGSSGSFAGKPRHSGGCPSDLSFLSLEDPEEPEDEDGADGGDGLPKHASAVRDAELLIWAGDFNYRIDLPREEVIRRVQQQQWADLLRRDQALNNMEAGATFVGLREGRINFAPTYKFDKGHMGALAYDSSEKRRIPAWTDRIMFRGSAPFPTPHWDDAVTPPGVHDVSVEPLAYNCCMEVDESDHKPVWALLAASIPVVDQARKRIECSKILRRQAAASLRDPDIHIQSSKVELIQGHTTPMQLYNRGAGAASFSFMGDDIGTPLPHWINVWPFRGVLAPDSSTTVLITAALSEHSYDTCDSHQQAFMTLLIDTEFAVGKSQQGEDRKSLQLSVTCEPA